MLALSGAAETRNGAMLQRHNELVERLARGRTNRPIVEVAGSDAHALARVGRTYTEVPAANREEFLVNLRAGLGRPGGEHGSVPVLAVEIYTAIAQYWAGLLGLQRHDLSAARRLFGLAFSLVSLPFQFIPGAIAINQKLGEDRRVERYRRQLMPSGEPRPTAADGAPVRVART
jgi:hypothetical protein